MRTAHLTTILTLIAILLLTGGGPAFALPASQSNVTLTATGGYGADGAYLIGEWFPVRVTLNNPAGGNSRRVRVTVDSLADDAQHPIGTYSREVDLPAQSRKEVTLYSYALTFNRTLDVRLLDGNTQLDKVTITLSPYEQQTNLLIGVLSSDPSLLNVLNGESLGHTEYPPSVSAYYSSQSSPATSPARVSVVHLALSDLPPLSSALDDLGVIVLDDIETSPLSAAQKAALSAWVGRGGMLLGLGRPGGGGALSGVADLLPVTLGEPHSLPSVSSLGDLVATPITPTTQLLAPSASLRSGADVVARALASQEGTLLVAIGDLGRGHTAYVGLSPAIAPLKGWDGTVPLFKRIIAEHSVRQSTGGARRVGAGSQIFSTYGYYSGGMFDIPGLDLPSEGFLGFFLLIYIIIIGPVNFIVLRRMRRGELAWLTIPAVVLVFSIGAYVVGYGAKGGDLLVVRSNVIYTAPGLPQASVEQFFGIFSPQRGTYDLEVAADSAVSEIDPSGYGARPSDPALVNGGGDQGPTRLSNVNINTLSLRAYLAESAQPAESPLEATLYLGENAIEGTVRNRSGAELQDVALVHGTETQLIGNLSPGQEANVHLAFSQGAFTLDSPTRVLQVSPEVDTSGQYYYSYDNHNNSEAQRRYNRQVKLLGTGLEALVSTSVPGDMSVVALAWGPASPIDFSTPGHAPRTADLNLWTTNLQVRGDGPASPKLKAGSVPFSAYAPGVSPSWLDSGEGIKQSVAASPYIDLLVRLPIGADASGLRLEYGSTFGTTVAVLARNVQTGAWEAVGKLSTDTGTTTSLSLTNAASYTGPTGDVTFRLLPENSSDSLNLSTLKFSLNTDK